MPQHAHLKIGEPSAKTSTGHLSASVHLTPSRSLLHGKRMSKARPATNVPRLSESVRVRFNGHGVQKAAEAMDCWPHVHLSAQVSTKAKTKETSRAGEPSHMKPSLSKEHMQHGSQAVPKSCEVQTRTECFQARKPEQLDPTTSWSFAFFCHVWTFRLPDTCIFGA